MIISFQRMWTVICNLNKLKRRVSKTKLIHNDRGLLKCTRVDSQNIVQLTTFGPPSRPNFDFRTSVVRKIPAFLGRLIYGRPL